MNFKNRIISFLFLSLIAILQPSCKKYLDINTSPVTATKVDPKLLFGYAVTAWDANKNGGDAWIPIALQTQTIASGGNFGWGASNVYDISPYSLGNTWKVYYSTAGNNLSLAIKSAEESNNKNTAAECRVVLAQIMYEAATLYGDVPFSQAWNAAEFAYPKYDAQKDVFEGILQWLDQSLTEFDETSDLKISDYDIYYGGDISKWKKLVNSIKFKVLMTMVDKDPSKADAIGQMLANPSSMISSADESWIQKYKTTTNTENPKYRLYKTYTNGQNLWFFANKNVFDYMEPKNDPRIPRYFDMGPAAATYKAVGTEEEADTTTSLISAYLSRPDAPSVILSYQEISLLEAEAYARGLGVTKDLLKAQELYKNGVEASMTFYEADPASVQTYMTTQLTDLTTAADPVKAIHIQQWVDLMDRPMEAFVQWRRSGTDGNEVPALTLPPGAPAGPLIRRWIYSPDEIAANPNIPNPQPKYYDKMWFDL